MNDDLISRDKLRGMRIVLPDFVKADQHTKGWNECITYIQQNAPAVDAEPVRHSYWTTDDLGRTFCAGCKTRLPYVKAFDLDDDCGGTYEVEIDETDCCPNCGAKMDGGNADES